MKGLIMDELEIVGEMFNITSNIKGKQYALYQTYI